MAQGREVSGRAILRGAKDLYKDYARQVEPTGKRVAIIRFQPAPGDPPEWVARLEASRVSAEQKVKSFEHLGFKADHVVMPPATTRDQFAAELEKRNADPDTRAIIVQFPPPAELYPVVRDMEPAKDIDALLKDRSPYPVCATAEGIYRVVEPYAQDDPTIAVVGSRGFVGQGVVAMMKENGLRPIELDAGDDLMRVRDADIVVSVTGNPGILGRDHLQPHHRLVVDSGFVPQADGSVMGDVRREAYDIPQNITPVPGGIGPVEMATLMERVTRQEIDPNASSWKVEAQPYLTRDQMARSGSTAMLTGQAQAQQAQQTQGQGQGQAQGQRTAAAQTPAVAGGGVARAAGMRSVGGNAAPAGPRPSGEGQQGQTSAAQTARRQGPTQQGPGGPSR